MRHFIVWAAVVCLGSQLQAGPLRLEAENAAISARSQIVTLPGERRAVSRKDAAGDACKPAEFTADLRFEFTLPEAGEFHLWSRAAIDAAGAENMAKIRKAADYPQARVRLNDGRIGWRNIFLPWAKPAGCQLELQRVSLPAGRNTIAVQLPPHVQLDYLELRPVKDPEIPEKVRRYRPKIVPPASHPRLWLTAGTLGRIRKNLNHPDHRAIWEELASSAQKKFAWHPEPLLEVPFNRNLCLAVQEKAFYALVSGDAAVAGEAVALMREYLSAVNCGNRHDVCRDVGFLLHSAACVYDWCYGQMSAADRTVFRREMKRLRTAMECGWPPFRQRIIHGHGNEMQISRDLLSMAIAIYDEDPEPYRLCSFLVLEELVPMRNFEYSASPRHDQGISYGFYRHAAELSAGLLFKAMCGKKIFAPAYDRLYLNWLFLRRPDWGMLTDGDANMTLQYRQFSSPDTAFLAAAYSENPLIKADFLRMRRPKSENRVFYLILDDPELKAEEPLDSLPTALDYGKLYGSLLFRTGWQMGQNSDDAVAEVRGGGRHCGNHRHSDAGAFQIYYRTVLAGPIGLYRYYGTDYDYGFNKRSVSRSLLLCLDPEERFPEPRRGFAGNDGGSRFIWQVPESPEDLSSNPVFFYGKRLSCAFGPDQHRPRSAYFAAQLAGAYSAKIKSYVRRFAFQRGSGRDRPLILIVSDELESAKAEFRKYWQLTTQCTVSPADGGVRVSGRDAGGRIGNLYCRMLLPVRNTVEVLTGEAALCVFGTKYTPDRRETAGMRGSRVMFSPVTPAAADSFLTVLQITAGDVRPLEAKLTENNGMRIIEVGETVTALPAGEPDQNRPFSLQLAGRKQILAAGLEAGVWSVKLPGGVRKFDVEPEKNIICFEVNGNAEIDFIPAFSKENK